MAASAASAFDFVFHEQAGPLDAGWEPRLKEEYQALIGYMKQARETSTDWFRLKATDATGTRWEGVCWAYRQYERREFAFHVVLPSSYPKAPPDIFVPHFEGRTAKIYRGGRICLDVHFRPQWIENAPRMGIVHALLRGLAPWLATEVLCHA